MNVLITGGAGFIGSNFIRYCLKRHPEDFVICFDKLTYAGNYGNLKELADNPRFAFEKGDICDRKAVFDIVGKYKIDYIINFAAESHVDRSIEKPEIFLQTNFVGTGVLLDAAREFNVKRFHQISTDEVYGDLPLDRPDLLFGEDWLLKPSSPYSASKASADLLTLAYGRTFNVPVTISRCSNNYGPYQFPEKLIPLMICNAKENKKLPVYGDGKNVRDWLHVDDHCEAVDLIIRNGVPGEIYNIGGNNEIANIEIVKMLLRMLDRGEDLIEYVTDRKGHDRRYGINSQKLQRQLCWKPRIEFEKGLQDTVSWYLNNSEWIRKIRTGEYRESMTF